MTNFRSEMGQPTPLKINAADYVECEAEIQGELAFVHSWKPDDARAAVISLGSRALVRLVYEDEMTALEAADAIQRHRSDFVGHNPPPTQDGRIRKWAESTKAVGVYLPVPERIKQAALAIFNRPTGAVNTDDADELAGWVFELTGGAPLRKGDV